MIGRLFKSAADGADQTGRARLMRQAVKLAALLTMFGVAGFLVAASGIIPIKASSGHWAIIRWFLQFAKERSVSTHTLALEPPSLDEPWLVLKGAAHYEIGCRPCHGSPELQSPRIARQMTPSPPYLPETVSNWEPEELFYIVKHGIKFTGMPAWPSQQRDDEVWAMVTFLRAFPELDAEEYRRLVNGEAVVSKETVPLAGLPETETAPGAVITTCARCHGADGLGRELAAFPKLAGQHPIYFAASLEAFARGQRHSGIMESIAAGLSSEQIRELARHYERLNSPTPSLTSQQAAQAIERGQVIAEQGIPKQDVPACADCHGPSDTPRNPIYLMRHVAAGLSAEQMRDVARYYAALSPAPVLSARHEPRGAP